MKSGPNGRCGLPAHFRSFAERRAGVRPGTLWSAPVRWRFHSAMSCEPVGADPEIQSARGLAHSKRPRGGFSFLELLIVVALVLVLTTLYWGTTSRSRPRKQLESCRQNLEKLFIALEIYANDHASKFPELAGARTSDEALDLLVPRYTVDTSLFTCPGSQDPALPGGEALRGRKISYAYYMGRRPADAQSVLMSDRQVDTLSKTAGQSVFSITGQPPGNNHDRDGGNFLFCDGHAQPGPPRAAFSLGLTQGIVLLNPKP